MQGTSSESEGRSGENTIRTACIFRRDRVITRYEVSYIVFHGAILRWGAVAPKVMTIASIIL